MTDVQQLDQPFPFKKRTASLPGKARAALFVGMLLAACRAVWVGLDLYSGLGKGSFHLVRWKPRVARPQDYCLETVLRRRMTMLQKMLLAATGLLLFMAMTAPAKAQEQAEFTRLLDGFFVASKTGNIDKILSYYTPDRQKEIRSEIKKKDERKFFLLIARAQVPESYQVEHVAPAKDGRGATVYLVGEFPPMPEIERKRMRVEEMISFTKEQGQWKIDQILHLGDPDAVKRPSDLSCNPEDADMKVTGDMAGRIVKVEFKPDYSLVLLRVLDEEIAVFLARKEVLIKAGVPLEELAPWKIYEFTGHPHKSDKLKFFATGGHLAED